jgi:hypothetical protein
MNNIFRMITLLYRMACIFCGVLIFIIFVVDLQSQKISPTESNAYRIYERCGQKHRGSTANFFSVVSNNRYCYPADGVFITFDLMLFVQVSLQKWLGDEGNRARSRARVDYIIACAVPHPWTGLLS